MKRLLPHPILVKALLGSFWVLLNKHTKRVFCFFSAFIFLSVGAFSQNQEGVYEGYLKVVDAQGKVVVSIAHDGEHHGGVRLDQDMVLYTPDGILARKIFVGQDDGADYVFEEDYVPLSLKEMKAYVKENKHLPDVPSVKEMEAAGSYEVHKMVIGQLKNLEELVLHTLEQEEKIANQSQQIEELKARVHQLLESKE